MIRMEDLHWAAGFLEGEGCFSFSGKGLKIQVAQVQRWPLERLLKLFGGGISQQRTQRKPTHQICSQWYLSGFQAAALMMTIYPLLSPRRQNQIKQALAEWHPQKITQRLRQKCPRGHQYSPALRAGRPIRICKTCISIAHRNKRARRRRREAEQRNEAWSKRHLDV